MDVGVGDIDVCVLCRMTGLLDIGKDSCLGLVQSFPKTTMTQERGVDVSVPPQSVGLVPCDDSLVSASGLTTMASLKSSRWHPGEE